MQHDGWASWAVISLLTPDLRAALVHNHISSQEQLYESLEMLVISIAKHCLALIQDGTAQLHLPEHWKQSALPSDKRFPSSLAPKIDWAVIAFLTQSSAEQHRVSVQFFSKLSLHHIPCTCNYFFYIKQDGFMVPTSFLLIKALLLIPY